MLYEEFPEDADTKGAPRRFLEGKDNMFKALLVEDSSSFRLLLKNSLQDLFPSMEIIEAADGVEAFQRIDGNTPDLIFMDVRLPGENGLELTRRIKADNPNITIIILTSYDLPEYREEAIRCKADHFFSKDALRTEEIFTLVKSILLTKGFNADGS